MDSQFKESDRLFTYILEELKNSFSAFKHLEQQRSQYMAFYLAFLIGSISISATLMSNPENSANTKYGIFAIFFIVTIISIVLLAAIKKIGFALSRHQNKVTWIRQRLTENEDFDHDIMCGKYNSSHPLQHSKTFNTQLSSQKILTLMSISLILITVANLTNELLINSSKISLIVTAFLLEILAIAYLIKVIKIKIDEAK